MYLVPRNLFERMPSFITPMSFLVVASIALPIGMSTWQALLNNYAVEQVGFTGLENGFMQSLREVPGFLAFTAIFVLLVLREQTFAVVALAVFGIGVAFTGFFPTVIGLYCMVVVMSIGFHYFETVRQSLSLQWLPKRAAPRLLGKLASISAITALVVFGAIYVLVDVFNLDYVWIYLIAGGLVLALAMYLGAVFPHFKQKIPQRKSIVLRKRYWLYYALTFLSGARRQIFVAFAGFLLVEKFHYAASSIAILFFITHTVTWLFAERIGAWIGRVGERKALTLEYAGLVLVFSAYAFVDSVWLVGGLYILDHLLFVFALAIKTYFQKIADPGDIASTAGVSFTINHIAAVGIPAILGVIWLSSYEAVFLIGAMLAFCSLLLSQNVPSDPEQGNEVVIGLAAPRVAKTSIV